MPHVHCFYILRVNLRRPSFSRYRDINELYRVHLYRYKCELYRYKCVDKPFFSENNNISLQYFQLYTAPVNSSQSLILNHLVISVGGKHLKYTKTLKLCEITSEISCQKR